MYIAVKLWRDMLDKPDGIPDAWPALVKELGNSRTLPDNTWLLMKEADLVNYKQNLQRQYDKWLASEMLEE